MFLASINLQSFGRYGEKAARNIDRTSANGSKQKAGFGEGTPQQARPERAASISIREIVATGRYLLFTFSVSFENSGSKADTGFQNQA